MVDNGTGQSPFCFVFSFFFPSRFGIIFGRYMQYTPEIHTVVGTVPLAFVVHVHDTFTFTFSFLLVSVFRQSSTSSRHVLIRS
jgi:hypothetical protein